MYDFWDRLDNYGTQQIGPSPDPVADLELPDCHFCGEGPDLEMAEAFNPNTDEHVVCHENCIPGGWDLS